MDDIKLMEQALVESGIIDRLSYYADRLPTMQPMSREVLAAEWAPIVVKAYLEARERQPRVLLCGCDEGMHDNTLAAIKEVHKRYILTGKP